MRREHYKAGGGEPVIPSGYTQLNYIESTGTQYIDIGIGVCANIETGCLINYPAIPEDTYNYGVYYNNDSDTLAVNFRKRNYGNLDFRAGLSYQTPSIQLVANTDYLIEQTKTQFAITNMSTGTRVYKNIQTKTSGNINNRTIIIFAVKLSSGKAAAFMSFKLKHFFVKVNDALVWNGIPALRDYDTKPGLYETVNNVFYTNLGTGEFLYA